MVKISLVAIFLAIFARQAGAEPDWWGKVDPFLLAQVQARPAAASDTQIEFLVQMAVQADLSAAAEIEGKLAKGTFVYEQLTAELPGKRKPHF
ncbi:MAG: hypothetical protein R3D55_01980 [Chloroflexota bacterium]